MVKKADRPQHIIKTALELAATGHWSSVSLRGIADASDVSLAEMYTLYPSKPAILRAYFALIDAAVLGTKFAFNDEDGRVTYQRNIAGVFAFGFMQPTKLWGVELSAEF